MFTIFVDYITGFKKHLNNNHKKIILYQLFDVVGFTGLKKNID